MALAPRAFLVVIGLDQLAHIAAEEHPLEDSVKSLLDQWCKDNCKGAWLSLINIHTVEWCFSCANDAMFFKLRWA